jgi:hypothetical protein
MNISEISTEAYLRIEKVTGGLHISPLHLYADCSHLRRTSDPVMRRLVVVEAPEVCGPLLDGLRVCERCRKQFERERAKSDRATGRGRSDSASGRGGEPAKNHEDESPTRPLSPSPCPEGKS